MFGRMIHGMNNGKLYEVPQVYDVYQRVPFKLERYKKNLVLKSALRHLELLTEEGSTNGFWTYWRKCRM